MKLIAKKPLRYGGVSILAGGVFEAKDKHGKLLKASGKADDAPAPKVEKIKPVSDENVSADKANMLDVVPKRTYQRRDMKAED